MICDVCGSLMAPSVCDWTFRCANCGLWKSSLLPAIDSPDHQLNEGDRFKGLAHVRRGNSDGIFDRLSRLTVLKSRRLLDVGCAYGWFLEEAVARGMAGVGIEPDAGTAQVARSRGLRVMAGYFPACLSATDVFDVIVFNDVLEHLPDLHGTLGACSRVLASGGWLVLSLPTSSGTLFRLAHAIGGKGWNGPWRRLWQQGFPSPHLYYFNRTNLDSVLRKHGFSREDVQETTAFHPRGLWSRLQFDRRSSAVVNVVAYLALIALYPVYRVLGRADTELLIYRYAARPDGARAANSQ